MGDGEDEGCWTSPGPSCDCRLITARGVSWKGDSALLTHSGHPPPPQSGLGRCFGMGMGSRSIPVLPGMRWVPPWDGKPTVYPNSGVVWEALACFGKEFVA